MARIRTIKPEFWTSAQTMECSPLARLLFIGMWNFADDAGRMVNSAKTIKAQVFPSDDITLDRVRGMIDELSSNDLVSIYEVDGKKFIQITGWHHQRIDRPKPSQIPGPIDDNSSNDRRSIAPDLTLPEGSLASPSDARDDDAKRLAEFQAAIVAAFGEANSPNIPDTSRAAVWKAKGYEPEICLAVIAELVRKRPSISSLGYFDNAIHEAHERKAPPRRALSNEPTERDWDMAMRQWSRRKSWPKGYGNDPESPACQAPPEIFKKYGVSQPQQH